MCFPATTEIGERARAGPPRQKIKEKKRRRKEIERERGGREQSGYLHTACGQDDFVCATPCWQMLDVLPDAGLRTGLPLLFSRVFKMAEVQSTWRAWAVASWPFTPDLFIGQAPGRGDRSLTRARPSVRLAFEMGEEVAYLSLSLLGTVACTPSVCIIIFSRWSRRMIMKGKQT